MSYYGGSPQYPAPPPLPPRRPRSPGSAAPPGISQPYWTYPTPPPGPPPSRSPGAPVEPVPPPIPPRPPGFEIRGPTVTGGHLSPATHSFPPPPLSPNRQAYPNTLPPPPPRPPLGNTAGLVAQSPISPSYSPVPSPQVTGQYGYTAIPPPGPVAGDPYGVQHVPPPPGPPPQHSQKSAPHTPEAIPAYDPSILTTSTAVHQAPDPPHINAQAHPHIPNSPPPAYTPIQENTTRQDVSIPSHPRKVSSPQGPQHSRNPSPPQQPPALSMGGGSSGPVDDLGATIQSLSIDEVPPPPQPPPQFVNQAARPEHTSSSSAPRTEFTPTPPAGSTTQNDQNPDPRQQPPACTQACISEPVTFATDWYHHPEAPDFWICSKCYVDHIWGTRYRDAFRHERSSEGGEKRVCRFDKPRLRDRLFQDAASTGDLGPVLEFMRRRSTAVQDCAGVTGIMPSTPGLRWYGPRAGDIPNFVCCEACYEDIVLAQDSLAGNFEPVSAAQDPKAMWACDFALPYVVKEYEDRARSGGDWAGFAAEAKARLALDPCPGRTPTSTWRRPWFVPAAGRAPDSIFICAACYCDRIWPAEAERENWRRAPQAEEDVSRRVRCAFSSLNTIILIGRCHDTKDFSEFWRVVNILEASEKFCDDAGIADGTWYTFRPGADGSTPSSSGFQICRACYLCVIEQMKLAPFFVRKTDISAAEKNSDGKVLCCFNFAHTRLGQGFLPRLLEGYYKRDARALRDYAAEYASIPPCAREKEAQNRPWYGWPDCTICPECWHEFARHHEPLAGLAELRGEVHEMDTMCEMYSPRMRNLYLECCGKAGESGTAADKAALLVPLLQFSAHRREVWCHTVLPIKRMLFESQMALNQQRFLNVVSTHYNMAGGIQEISMPSAYTYSQAGLGTFANRNYLQGAQYGAQAAGIAASMAGGDRVMVVGQLEQQWRAVE